MTAAAPNKRPTPQGPWRAAALCALVATCAACAPPPPKAEPVDSVRADIDAAADSGPAGGGDATQGDTGLGDAASAPDGQGGSTPDGGAQDGETPDALDPDAADSDAAAQDTALSDATLDAAPTDVTAADTAGQDDGDAGLPDGVGGDTAGSDGLTGDGLVSDGLTSDGLVSDGLVSDGVGADAASADGASPDGAGPDAASPDASNADAAGPADTTTADTGPPEVVSKNPAFAPQLAFVDVTAAYGFDPKAPYAFCAGVGDLDGDGDADLLTVELLKQGTQAQVRAVLLGGPKPVHVLSTFNTSGLVPNLGCTVYDHDGDGRADLIIGGSSGVALYLNDGKATFSDASAKLLPTIFDAQGSSFAPVDLDGDGDLDLVVGAGEHPTSCNTTSCKFWGAEFTCKVSPPPPLSSPHADRVLLRDASGKLTDVTAQWKLPTDGGYATYVSAWDVDLDGDQDLLIGTDFHTPWLLERKGAGFVHHSVGAGLHPYAHAMGWALADFNGDGHLDIALADLGPTALYQRKPGSALQYQDVSYQSPLAAYTVGTSDWTPVAADFDHDGREDLVLGASMALPKPQFFNALNGCGGGDSSVPSLDIVLLNLGAKGWQVGRTPKTGCGEAFGVAQTVVDLDGDGDLDLLQVRPGCNFPFGVVRVLRNDLPKAGGAIALRLVGKAPNTGAIGARVSASIGGVTRQRQIVASGGLGGGGQLQVHFGLGKATEATAVTVHWPGGGTTVVGTVKAGAKAVVQQP